MKNLAYNFMILLILCFGTSIRAEPETSTEPNTTLKKLVAEYHKAEREADVFKQYEVGKEIINKEINNVNLNIVMLWKRKVDSLEERLDIVPLDIKYTFTEIFLEHRLKQYDKEIRMLMEFKPIIDKHGTDINLLQWNCFLARVYSRQKDMATALEYLVEAEKLNYDLDIPRFKGELLNVRAFIEWQNNKNLSLALRIEAANIFESLNEDTRLVILYNDIIDHAKYLGEDVIVSNYRNKLEAIRKKIGLRKRSGAYENNQILDLVKKEKYKEAIDYADKAIAYMDSAGIDKTHATYLKGIAYRGMDDYDTAAQLIRAAYDESLGKGNVGRCAFYSYALYQTYSWREKFEQALRWYEKHTLHKDTIYNEKKATEIVVYKSKLDALKQQKRADNLQAEITIDNQRRKILWGAMISGSLIAVTLFYAQWQRNRKKVLQQRSLTEQAVREKELLQREIEFKKKEITTQVVNMTRKNNLLQEVVERIEGLSNHENNFEVSKIKRLIEHSLDNSNEWDTFNDAFRSIHSSFFKKLNKISDEITSGELRLVSLMKMNLTSKEIASVLNISDDGVKKARYRLRKKLDLPSEINIQEYILSI